MYGYGKRTLLHKAAQIGDPVVCQLLIDHGADVNKQDARKQTPLWVSAEEGHKDICEVLIQNGASVGKEDASQRTPLWIAAHKKHEDVCKILIDNGAEIFGKDELRIGVPRYPNDYLKSERILHWYYNYGKVFNLFTLFRN